MSLWQHLRSMIARTGKIATQHTGSRHSGAAAEDAALAFLRQQGLTLVQRNFLCRGGEIDLIMQDGDILVFVEVRQRSSASHGGALASVTRVKQKHLIIAAEVFLQRYCAVPTCRFDIVADDSGQIQWLKNGIQNWVR